MNLENWRDRLIREGYVHFPDIIPSPLITAAKQAIDRDLEENYDSDRQIEYDNMSYCPALRGKPVIKNLLQKSPIVEKIDKILGWQKIGYSNGQIAIRWAREEKENIDPIPHIDGIPTGLNGVKGNKISNFTALVGVYLTKTPRTFAGNFTVWPRSHYILEQYFRDRGIKAMSEGMPAVDIGKPNQLICDVGDAILCHYQLAHTVAVNTSDVDRIAVYFRIWFNDIDTRRWQLLTNIWDGWNLPAIKTYE